MTRLERRIHRLIEKAILEHGYVLRTMVMPRGSGFADHDTQDCCLLGAISLSCPKLTHDNGTREAVAQFLGMDAFDVQNLEAGYEEEYFSQFAFRYGDPFSHFYQLGASLRERYVVQS